MSRFESYLEGRLETDRDLKRIILIGGFSESPYIRQQLTQRYEVEADFDQQAKIMTPYENTSYVQSVDNGWYSLITNDMQASDRCIQGCNLGIHP